MPYADRILSRLLVVYVLCRVLEEQLHAPSRASARKCMDDGDQDTGADQCYDETSPEAKRGIGYKNVHQYATNKGSY